MNICSEHHEIKRKIRIIILRIIDIYIFTHSKICFVCISKVICTVHVTSVNIKFISEDLDWELQKDIFADQNISTIYMYLKHDQKLWSLWKVLQNISTVFSVWIKAWTWHMEVWVFFFSPMQSWHSSPIAESISRSRYSIGLLPFVSKVTWN